MMRNRLSAIVLALSLSVSLLPACSTSIEPIPFSLKVIPEQLKGNAIAGQLVVFLVVVDEEDGGGIRPVGISAEAPGAAVSVSPENASQGQVAEVTVVPDEGSIEDTITLTVKGVRDGLEKTTAVSFEVVPGEDDRAEVAAEMRDRFIPWLSVNRPELGITQETAWQGTMVSPQWLVVSHYLFFSEEWEMHVSWHNMIPPYDWTKIDLRSRLTESEPSHAFEISSVSAGSEPQPADLPDSVWR